MDLRAWLDSQENLSKKDFAARIGLAHVQSLYRYLDGSQVPRGPFMTAIIRETGGAVTANDFVKSEDGKAA